jgi:ADP-heptose:LPS heptosyltransferase
MVERRPSVLFLIRDKLGDSLIAANVALLFARRHPEWEVSVMIRDAYAHPLAHEAELNVIPFRTGLGAQLTVWWWRLSGRRYDVLGVLRGFGKRTLSLVRGIPAQRVIVHDERLAAVATEVVSVADASADSDPHYGPAWRVARALDSNLPAPDRLEFPALARRWNEADKRLVAICPLSDEPRRNMSAAAIEALYDALRLRHSDREVVVLTRDAGDLKALARFPSTPIKEFRDIPGLIELFLQCSHYYGTDTGLLHMAAAMGMPCTVFFGPTQPHRVLLPGQPDVAVVRESILGDRHCDIKSCTRPVCIEKAVATLTGTDPDKAMAAPPPGCPLIEPGNTQ